MLYIKAFSRSRRRLTLATKRLLPLILGAVTLRIIGERRTTVDHVSVLSSAYAPSSIDQPKVLVIYAYSEGLGDGGLLDEYNLRYFIRVALTDTMPGSEDPMGKVDYLFSVSGYQCSPCKDLLPRTIQRRRSATRVDVIHHDNYGMDFGAYNVSLSWVSKQRPDEYKFFVFINSSLRGPFMPKWTPKGFHFTDVLTQYFQKDAVKLVGSYISCLPTSEELPGPVMESLFFAVDNESLSWLVEDGIFARRMKKRDTAIFGEYSLTPSVFRRGGEVETLNIQYANGLNWQDRKHHHCNGNRHSSRRGSNEGISPQPLAHVFVKISWCVRAAEVTLLSKWLTNLASGKDGTEGKMDQRGYLLGISTNGTRGKDGSLPPDIPQYDGCAHGDLRALQVI